MAKTWYTKAASDSTFAKLADAVALETAVPLSPTPSGFAGTSNTAARGDHRHPQQPIIPSVWNYSTGQWLGVRARAGAQVSGRIGWLLLVPWWLQTIDRTPLVVNAIGTRTGAAGSSDSTVKFAVYKATATGDIDWTTGPLVQTTALATNTSGTDLTYTLGSNLSLPCGGYWVASILAGTTAAALPSVSSSTDDPGYASGASVPQAANSVRAKASQTTFPAAGTSVTPGDDPNDWMPIPFFKVA